MHSKLSTGIIATLSALALTPTSATGQLCINEVMQSNIHVLYVDNDFPDSWVELYNGSDSPINIKGWKLGASEKVKKAYTLPVDSVIEPGGFVTIYCDKEETGLHTSFRVESGSGVVILYNPDGEVVDRIDHGKMVGPDIAFGRIPDGGEEIAHFVAPSPGASNIQPSSTTVMSAPVFSHKGGIYSQPFEVTISSPTGLPDDARLCVTFDGSEPSLSDSVEGGLLTTEITKNSVVRASIISPTSLNPLSVTQSYIFESTSLPIVSIVTNPEYLWSDSIGILHGVAGEDPNWAYDWRRPVNTELFLPDEDGGFTTSFNQLGETRLKGSSSRSLPQKSMVVYANKRFGTKRMDCSGVWPEKPWVTDVKSFELKNGGADFDRAHMRDPLANLLAGRNNPDVDWQAYRPSIVYFNGEYRGIFDLRERTNEDFIDANYDGLEDIDMVENWVEEKAGDISNLVDLYNRLISPKVTFEEIDSLVDWDNILPQYALNVFGANYDSGGGNNTVMWRRLEGDTRWRLILKDLDLWGGTWQSENTDYDIFKETYIKQYEYSAAVGDFRYKALSYFIVTNPTASQMLLDHLLVAMGDYLNPDYISEVIDELKEGLQEDYPRYMTMYFPDTAHWMSYGNWNNQVERLRKFSYARRDFMYPYLAEYYGLKGSFGLQINRHDCPTKMNGISLSRPVFEGRYYHDRELRLTTREDYGFEVVMTGGGQRSVIASKGDEIEMLIPEWVENVAVEVTATPSSIDDVTTEEEDSLSLSIEGDVVKVNSPTALRSITAYDSSGIMVSRSSKGEKFLLIPARGIYLIQVVTDDGKTKTLKAVVTI